MVATGDVAAAHAAICATIDGLRDGSLPLPEGTPAESLHEVAERAGGADGHLDDGALRARLTASAPGVVTATGGAAAPGGVRAAVVIANATSASRGPLAGVATRAAQMAAALRGLAFDVTEHVDLRASELRAALVGATAGALAGDDVVIAFAGGPAGAGGQAVWGVDDQTVGLGLFDRARAEAASRGFRATAALALTEIEGSGDAVAEGEDGAWSRDKGVAGAERLTAWPEDDRETLELVTLAEGMRLRAMASFEAADRFARMGGARLPTDTQEQRAALHRAIVAAVAARRARGGAGSAVGEGRVRLVGSTREGELARDSGSFGGSALDRKGQRGGDTTEALVHEQQHYQGGARFGSQAGTSAELVGAAGTRKRALVVGNSRYHRTTSLAGAERDADRAAASFASDGYEVDHRRDLEGAALRAAVLEATARLVRGDKATFFYAGHGSAEGLLGVESVYLTNADIGRAVKGPRERGAEVTVVADSCHSGTLVREGAAAVEGSDHLPVLTPRTGDDARAATLIDLGSQLRDGYLVTSGGGVFDRLDQLAAALRAVAPRLRLSSPASLAELAEAHARVAELLAERRGELAKQAYLAGA